MKRGIYSLIILIVIISIIVIAHSPEEEHEELGEFDVSITPSQAIQGDSIPVEAHISKDGQPVSNLQVFLVMDNHDIGVSDRLSGIEREPGHYFSMYKFKGSGAYEVHVEFSSDDETIRRTFPIDIITSKKSQSTYFLIIAVIALIFVWVYGLKEKKKKIKKSIILSIVVLAIIGIVYSLFITLQSGARSSGLIVCPQEDKCYWTAHVHAYVPIKICGEDKRLPIELGPLNGPHTHEEKNIIHWHDRLPYDNVNKRLLETKPLTLGAFFDAINANFNSNSILDKNNNDVCLDGTQGKLKMFVNGKRSNQFRDFIWKDKDVIFIIFDNESYEEIEAELMQNSIKFPALGRG